MLNKYKFYVGTQGFSIRDYAFRLFKGTERFKINYLVSFSFILVLMVWYSAFKLIKNDEESIRNQTILNITNLSRSFKAYTEETINTSDQVLRFLRFQNDNDQTLKYSSIKEFFDKGILDTHFITSVSLIDSNGQYRFTSLNAFKMQNISDAEFFKIHKSGYPYGVFVSSPERFEGDDHETIQLTRGIYDRTKKLAGVAIVSVDPRYFIDIYKNINVGENGIIALVGLDGTTRVVSKSTNVVPNLTKVVIPLPTEIQSKLEGTFISDQLFDKVNRLYAYQRIGNQPLVTLVGKNLMPSNSDASHSRLTYSTIALLLTVIIVLFLISNLDFLNKLALAHFEIQKTNKKITEANNNRSEFLSSVSHEIRTPLNGILGYAEYIIHTSKESMIQFPAQIIYESSQHLLRLVNTLLDLTLVESGKLVIQNSNFNFYQIVEEVCQTHQVRMTQKNIKLVVEIDDHCPQLICLDELNLRRILNNLIDNAIKFSKNAGEITLSSQYLSEVNSIYISIKDNGIGIPKEKHSQVFEKFWQNEDYISRSHGGSGMGLALTQKLVKLMGGEIHFNSSPNDGSIFYFSLPLAKEVEYA
jgi:signal transduction histidine kinase